MCHRVVEFYEPALVTEVGSLPAECICLGNRTELLVPDIDWKGKKRTALKEGAQNPSQS